MTADLNEQNERLEQKVLLLRGHIDHLMGQIYHQVELIAEYRDRANHLEQELKELEEFPQQLDEALRHVSNLREELAGRSEVEFDLRQRLTDLEREDEAKAQHIKKLERYLNRVWHTPHRRLLRAIKNTFRSATGRGESNGRLPFEEGEDPS